MRHKTLRATITCAFICFSFACVQAAPVTAPVTECSVGKICYCISPERKADVLQRVALIRDLIAEQKRQGKLIGYLSTPLSSTGGGYFSINAQAASAEKLRIENRLGSDSAWIVNPGEKAYSLPSGATGADYMYMWTLLLEGESGLGADFDFVNFVGPNAFARFFSLTGENDAGKIGAYYDEHAKSDPGLAKIERQEFIRYYALRAATTFSLGAHDEWNLMLAINQRRRESAKFGVARQIGIFFNDQAVAPALYETGVTAGNAGACSSTK